MHLPDKYDDRLPTNNFTKVRSEAVRSIDYNATKKIIEIEWKQNPVNLIYHYLNTTKKEWAIILTLGKKGEGLGAYLNRNFKKVYDTNKRDYYQLNKISQLYN